MSLTFRRNYGLLIALALVIVLLTAGLGNLRVIAYTVAGSETPQAAGVDVTNSVALFDASQVHSVQILISDEDYEQMLTTYKETGAKDYFQADVIIDGVRMNDVGLRLKGNASLRTAAGGGMGMGMGGERPEGMGIQPGGEPPADRPARGNPPAAGGNLPGGPVPSVVDESTQAVETKLPMLIKFDEYVEGQTYQGHAYLALRTYGISKDAAMLQEPVTNAVFRTMGQPATQTAYAGVRLNDEDELLYVLSEIVDEVYLAENFDYADGILYKSEVGSTLAYQGEDPSAYATSFTQETRENEADLAPLIEFVRFIDSSDDATFAAELPAYLDVDGFATYLAVNSLLVNSDSMAGMSNNYYLYYDDVTERFSVLMWDANESLGKLTFGGQAVTFDLLQAGQAGQANAQGGGRGGMNRSNELVTRFLANADFKALYLEKLQAAYETALSSGFAQQLVQQTAQTVGAAVTERGLVDADAYASAVASTLDFLNQRTAYLAEQFQ
ncbi:MAG: CotH kinase family protein [Anaerolineae bacterium]|nr:CotH kinase family protein [Anaerolineae bacterium]